MKIEMVKFKDGTFGVRKTRIFKKPEFLDLKKNGMSKWRLIDDDYLKDCKGGKGEVYIALQNITDYGIPCKEAADENIKD